MEFSVIYDSERTPKGVDHHQKVTEALASEFRRVQSNNPMGCVDSFEQSFWSHCETVARKLRCRLTEGKNGEPLFDFVTVKPLTVGSFREYCDEIRG